MSSIKVEISGLHLLSRPEKSGYKLTQPFFFLIYSYLCAKPESVCILLRFSLRFTILIRAYPGKSAKSVILQPRRGKSCICKVFHYCVLLGLSGKILPGAIIQ